jgi:glycosyltransferase involved in cell wall biosynthesis
MRDYEDKGQTWKDRDRLSVPLTRMNGPTVSIGLPVYNCQAFLEAALDSILGQGFGDFELIISDNASSDDTGAICGVYAKRDKRIRLYRSETNIGVNPNHDRVFELSVGKYFMWTAHDVEWLPGMLKRCVQVMQEAPASVVLAYPRCEVIQDGQTLSLDEQMSIARRDARPHKRVAAVIRRVVFVDQLFGLSRREALAQTRLNEEYPSSDYVLLAELAMLGQIWEIPEVLLRRRIDSDRGTAAVHQDQTAWRAWLNVNNKKDGKAWIPHRERLALEYMLGAWRLPLKPADKLLCLMTILPTYYGRMSRSVRFMLNVTAPWRHKLRLSRGGDL